MAEREVRAPAWSPLGLRLLTSSSCCGFGGLEAGPAPFAEALATSFQVKVSFGIVGAQARCRVARSSSSPGAIDQPRIAHASEKNRAPGLLTVFWDDVVVTAEHQNVGPPRHSRTRRVRKSPSNAPGSCLRRRLDQCFVRRAARPGTAPARQTSIQIVKTPAARMVCGWGGMDRGRDDWRAASWAEVPRCAAIRHWKTSVQTARSVFV